MEGGSGRVCVGGVTLIFLYIRRFGPFLGIQNSEFQYFGFFLIFFFLGGG